MGEDSREPLAQGSDDAPRWRIVEVVPLASAAPPVASAPPAPQSGPLAAAGAPYGQEPVSPSHPAPRPQRTSAQDLWGELDTLLTDPPLGEPLASSGSLQHARSGHARRHRRQRRLRRIGLAVVLGAGLGAAVWWWAPSAFQHQFHLHAGYHDVPTLRSAL